MREVHILASTPSDKPISLERNMRSSNDSPEYSEYSEGAAPERPAMPEVCQPAGRERRKDHQAISTAAYYVAERRAFGGYGYDAAQDWETDGEIEDM